MAPQCLGQPEVDAVLLADLADEARREVAGLHRCHGVLVGGEAALSDARYRVAKRVVEHGHGRAQHLPEDIER